MTTPVAHDNPDWGRGVAASDIVVTTLETVQINASTDTARVFVGNTPYISVFFVSGAVRGRVSLVWYTAATGGLAIGSDDVTAFNAAPALGAFAVRAPYVAFTIEQSAYPDFITLRVMNTYAPVGLASGLASIELIAVDGTVIGAGATTTLNATAVRWGWGFWHALFEEGLANRFRLYQVDFFGNTHLLDTVTDDEFGRGKVIPLPPAPVRVFAENFDAVGRELYVSVIHHPFSH